MASHLTSRTKLSSCRVDAPFTLDMSRQRYPGTLCVKRKHSHNTQSTVLRVEFVLDINKDAHRRIAFPSNNLRSTLLASNINLTRRPVKKRHFVHVNNTQPRLANHSKNESLCLPTKPMRGRVVFLQPTTYSNRSKETRSMN